jgi:PhnB protein
MAVKPIPEGYHSVTPYLAVDDASAAIEFYKQAFGATERMRMPAPSGKIGHAEVEIGASLIMLSDPFPSRRRGRRRSSVARPAASSSTSRTSTPPSSRRSPPAGRRRWSPRTCSGDRFGSVIDPFGHHWSLATHKEDLTEEEIAERGQAAMAEMAS